MNNNEKEVHTDIIKLKRHINKECQIDENELYSLTQNVRNFCVSTYYSNSWKKPIIIESDSKDFDKIDLKAKPMNPDGNFKPSSIGHVIVTLWQAEAKIWEIVIHPVGTNKFPNRIEILNN